MADAASDRAGPSAQTNGVQMNAIPMLKHCGYHQRQHQATCSQCGAAVSFLIPGIKVGCVACRDWVEPVPVGPCPVCR